MKKTLIILIIFASLIFSFGSCNDPIFYTVSQEIKQNDPKINGSPSKFLEANGYLWVASKKALWKYNSNDGWVKDYQTSLIGDIAAVASSGNSSADIYLYIERSGRGIIINHSKNKEIELSSDNVQTIYSANGVLFIIARNNNIYTLYYLYDANDNDDIPLHLDTGDNAPTRLCGVAYNETDNDYYICTDIGVFIYNGAALQLQNEQTEYEKFFGSSFAGIINLKPDKIAAITRSGSLYLIPSPTSGEDALGSSIAGFSSSDHVSSGALTLWKSGNDEFAQTILLAGRQGKLYSSSATEYTHGYVELLLDINGDPSGTKFSEPGKQSPSTVDSYERFVSSLGPNPVNHIIQTPYEIDDRMIIFASTHQKGVWSYRFRDNKYTWNAED
ncbi:MAG: hypothetical protein FWB77_05175 [Treponema sp.]|nr:hypothetical protein [Treponema sp.]